MSNKLLYLPNGLPIGVGRKQFPPPPVGSVLYLPGYPPGEATIYDRSGNTIASDNAKQLDANVRYGYLTEYVASGLTLTVASNLTGVRVKFDLKTWASPGYTAYGKLYKNGVAWGTEQTKTGDTDYTTKSEDFTSLAAGDVITVWTKTSDEAVVSSVRNLSICYDFAPNNGAIIGATWARYPSGLPRLFFDGAGAGDDIVTVTDHASIQDIWDGGGVIAFSFKVGSSGKNDTGIIFRKVPAAYTAGWYLATTQQSGSALKLQFGCKFDGAANGLWNTTDRVITINTEYRGIIMYNSGATTNDPSLYLNGSSTPIALTEASTPVGTRVSDAGVNLTIGNRPQQDAGADAYLALEEFYKGKTYSTADIANDYARVRRYFGV